MGLKTGKPQTDFSSFHNQKDREKNWKGKLKSKRWNYGKENSKGLKDRINFGFQGREHCHRVTEEMWVVEARAVNQGTLENMQQMVLAPLFSIYIHTHTYI